MINRATIVTRYITIIRLFFLLFQMFFITKMAKIALHLICVTLSVYCRHDLKQSLLLGIKEGTGEIDNVTITR